MRSHRHTFKRYLLAIAAVAILPSASHADHACSNGAHVKDEKFCEYFSHFNRVDSLPDPRISGAWHLTRDDRVRSLALIVAVGKYPNLSGRDKLLLPATIDGNKLEDFFVNDQKFDEVVILRDEQATEENINYFLKEYFRTISQQYHRKSRFVFAYSGHGTRGTPAVDSTPASGSSLVLSNAASSADFENTVSLSSLKSSIDLLDAENFHVLVLLNSCYGGDLFKNSVPGGDPNDVEQAGARAVTAAGSDDLVYSLGKPGEGSIFFDTLIEGVKTGAADFYPPTVKFQDGSVKEGGGLIRLGPLTTYIDDILYRMNASSNSADHRFRNPWTDTIEPSPTVAKGGFFFLSSARPGSSSVSAAPMQVVPAGPGNELPSFSLPSPSPAQTADTQSHSNSGNLPVSPLRPREGENSVGAFGFYSPADYGIKGVDVSHYSGFIDWAYLIKRPSIRFAYLKATQGATYKDSRFQENWVNSAAAGIRRGAYHYFTACADYQSQFQNIAQTIPNDDDALPIALDVELFSDSPAVPGSKIEFKCEQIMGISAYRTRLIKLIALIEERYHKKPIIFTAGDVTKDLLDNRFAGFRIWIANNGSMIPIGSRPWTLWQYAAPRLGPMDLSVFFGNDADFTEFYTRG